MSEENKIELANCPFCGSSRIEQVSFNLGALVQLECNGCRLKTPRFSSIKSVSNFWNSRADNPRITELETELRTRNETIDKIIEAANNAGWNGVTNPKQLWRFIEFQSEENTELRAEVEQLKNQQANDAKAMDIIERASKYFGENPDFAVEFSNVKKENASLRAENERLKQAEKTLLDAISDWYYLHPNPKADEVLSKQYENFLTFGQGGANFSEAQDLAEEAI